MFSLAKRLFTSSLAADQYFSSVGNIHEGLRIVNVDKESIGYQMGLESWFDYILSVNGFDVTQLVGKDFSKFIEMVVTNIDNERDLVFAVWSAKGGTIRNISVPSTKFSSVETDGLDEIRLDGSPNVFKLSKYKKLGISVQMTSLETATYVWHVLQTLPNSPGHSANLLPGSDYIIGAQDGLLAMGGEDLLGQILYTVYSSKRESASLVLYVYNHTHNVVRPVTIYPNRNWGGIGLLGCDVGYGFLHRIPDVDPENAKLCTDTRSIKTAFIGDGKDTERKKSSQPIKQKAHNSCEKIDPSESSPTITDASFHEVPENRNNTTGKLFDIGGFNKQESITLPPSISNVSSKTQLDCPIPTVSSHLTPTPYHARKKRHRQKVDLTEYLDEKKESPNNIVYTNTVPIPTPPSPPPVSY